MPTFCPKNKLPVKRSTSWLMLTNKIGMIATANNRDKGVNDLSSALKRRFNTVILPLPASLQEETEIHSKQVICGYTCMEHDRLFEVKNGQTLLEFVIEIIHFWSTVKKHKLTLGQPSLTFNR